MTHEEAKERIKVIPVKSAFDESLVGWEPLTRSFRESSMAGLPLLVEEYDRVAGSVMVRLKSEKLQVWIRSERADLWKNK